ncbi:MAG TPA: DUF4129 domain-containing protein [Clostridia bacterium]|nr:DUF4129 domain-containing protein [Clostridia bacterium]
MKLVRRSVILRILAVVGVNLYICAGFFTLRASLFGTYGGLIPLLLFFAAGVSGFAAGRMLLGRMPAFLSAVSGLRAVKFITFMLNVKNRERFIAAFSAWIIVLLPLAVSIGLYGGSGPLRVLFELVPVTAAYIAALKQSRLGASQIMSNASVYSGFFILVLSLELANISQNFFSDISYLKPWLFGVSYFFIFAFLVVRNQEDIDTNIFEKKHIEKSILPKNLRSFNTIAVCVVFVLIILLFNLKAVIMAIMQLIGNLAVLVMKFILWVVGKLFSESGVEQDNGAPSGGALFGFGIQPVSPVGNLIFNIVRNFTLYYIVYRVVLAIIRIVPKVSRKLAELLKKLFSLERGDKSDTISDFVDETETVIPERKQKHAVGFNRSFSPVRKDLRRIKDPAMKVRYMFSIILKMLPAAGVQPDRSDTPAELVGKAGMPQSIAEGLSPFAAIYNQVRYGEKVPDRDMLDNAELNFNKAVDAMEHKH